MKTQRLRGGKRLVQCHLATERWNGNIRSQAGPLSITPKCPLWYPYIILRAGSMQNTDKLGNKSHILSWLWASPSLSLGLIFLFCTIGCWSLRVFPALTTGALRASHSIALIFPLWRCSGSPPSQSCASGRSPHPGPQPDSGKHSPRPLTQLQPWAAP